MTKTLLHIGILLVLVGAFACNASKKAGTSAPFKKRTEKQVVQHLQSQKLTSNHINAKAKIRFDDGEQRVTFNANLRMVKDSLIWVNATFLSYEVARILIRPDSIFVINRWEKTYMKDTYEGFDEEFEIPVSYDQLQEIVMGNHLLQQENPIDFQLQEDQYLLNQQLSEYITRHIVSASSLELAELNVLDKQSGYEIQLKLDDYRPLENALKIPYYREYIIKNNNAYLANIQLNLSSIDTKEKKKTPFSIPDHYELAR